MKKLYFFLLLCLLNYNATSQSFISITFEDSAIVSQSLEIDTINFPNNKWQVGIPSKPIFDSSFNVTLGKAIVTDTLNYLPPSDTSVFIIKQARPFSFPSPSFSINDLSFYYKMDKRMFDIAKVEISADTGKHWVNMISEDTTYNIQWSGNKPNFDDMTAGWKHFNASFSQWFSASYNGVTTYPYYADSDTFLYRFTFITDSLSSNKEGWMIDDIQIRFLIPESNVERAASERSVILYPNPAKNTIHFKRALGNNQPQEKIEIFSMLGQMLQSENVKGKSSMQINVPSGQYLLRYTSMNKVETYKISIE